MALIPSTATPHEISDYTSGSCHVFAVALHRLHGWPIHLVLDQAEHFWDDPKDADNWIPSVIHAYAIDDDGQAWDIGGVRPLGEVRAELLEVHHIGEYDSDRCRSEDSLKTYVGSWKGEFDDDEIDRPLDDYSQADVDEAIKVARRALDGLPGFPASPVASPA